MSAAVRAADVIADWAIRLYEDAALLRRFWQLLRAARHNSPIARVKLASAQAILAAVRAEEVRAQRDGSSDVTKKSPALR